MRAAASAHLLADLSQLEALLGVAKSTSRNRTHAGAEANVRDHTRPAGYRNHSSAIAS